MPAMLVEIPEDPRLGSDNVEMAGGEAHIINQ